MTKPSKKEAPVIAGCPGCGARYVEAPDLVDERKDLRIFHQICGGCGRAMLFAWRQRRGGWVCAGLFTDCTAEEAKRFIFAEKISVNDVLGAHNALQFDNFFKMR